MSNNICTYITYIYIYIASCIYPTLVEDMSNFFDTQKFDISCMSMIHVYIYICMYDMYMCIYGTSIHTCIYTYDTCI